jgi:rhodanese-related sulfurtransferase
MAGIRVILAGLGWQAARASPYRLSMTTTTASGATMTDSERDAAIEHFAAKLRYETDPTDVAGAVAAGDRFAFVDTRGHSSWHQGRARGAVHIPRAEIAVRAAAEIPIDTPVVVYCWGPACNGATRSAIEFLKLGYSVREMIGGFEYWAREGLGVVDDHGPVDIPQDRLTSAIDEAGCDC